MNTCFVRQLPEPDLAEVGEWGLSLDGRTDAHGAARARRALLHVLGRADELHPNPGSPQRPCPRNAMDVLSSP